MFTKCFIIDLLQSFEYASGSKYAGVFNIPWLRRLMNMSEYA